MTVKKIVFYLIFYLLMNNCELLLINDQKNVRILDALSEKSKLEISQKFMLCSTKTCEKKLLFDTLLKLDDQNEKLKKKRGRKLSIDQKDIIHILIIMIFVFIMFNSSLGNSLIITPLIIFSIFLMLLYKTKERRLSLDSQLINFANKNYNRILREEKSNLYRYLKLNEFSHIEKMSKNKYKRFIYNYLEDVHNKQNQEFGRIIDKMSNLIFAHQKSIRKTLAQFIEV